MNAQRTHHITSSDGVTIGSSIHGEGPPLVFLQGVVGDGDLDWQAVLPHLAERFTCHLLSNRGRGLSGDHSDLSIGRLGEDAVTYVNSIGEPTGLVGWSLGASLSLMVAAQSDAVNAIVPCEPTLASMIDEQWGAAMGEVLARTGELAAEGNLAAAVRAFCALPFNDEEIAVAEEAGYCEATGRYVPELLSFHQQFMEAEDPPVDEATMLGALSLPVLVVKGSDTKPFFTNSARYVIDHVPHARVQEIPGAGHAAPLTHPEALAKAFTEFFAPAHQPT